MSGHPPIVVCCDPPLAGPAPSVRLFETLVSSGILAGLSSPAFKVLVTLALSACPLGGGPGGEALFQTLLAAGICAPADRGAPYCRIPHRDLAQRSGVSKNTLSRSTAELVGRGLIFKCEIAGPQDDPFNIYLLLPASPPPPRRGRRRRLYIAPPV